MNSYTMVVIIVVVGVLGNIAMRYLKLREKSLKQAPPPELDADLNTRLEKIEKRLQALETIVTDSRFDLDRAFEDLENDNGSGEQ